MSVVDHVFHNHVVFVGFLWGFFVGGVVCCYSVSVVDHVFHNHVCLFLFF